MKRGRSIDMTQGPILSKLIMFAFPLMLSSVINTLYSTADTIMMGQFAGAAAMAAVGASTYPLRLLVNFFGGLALGADVLCANLRGAKKESELRDAMHGTVVAGFCSGAAVAVIGLIVTRPLLQTMGTPDEILDDAVLYMSLRLSAGPAWLTISFCDHILYAHGDTKIPVICGASSGILNVALNVVFVPILGMGVEGVAIASISAQILHAAFLLYILFSQKGIYKLKFTKLRLRLDHLKRIFSVGLPTGLNNVVFSIANVVLQSAINGFGYLVVAGSTAADNIVTYVAMIHNAYGAACLSGASQCYGAKNYKRIDEIAKRAIASCLVIITVVAGTVMLFAEPLMKLFTDEPAAIEAGCHKLWFMSWGYMIFAFGQMFVACMRAIRKATTALICNVAGVTVPRLLWVWLVVPFMNTTTILYLIYPISWLTSSVILGIAYFHYRKKLFQMSEIQTVEA